MADPNRISVIGKEFDNSQEAFQTPDQTPHLTQNTADLVQVSKIADIHIGTLTSPFVSSEDLSIVKQDPEID